MTIEEKAKEYESNIGSQDYVPTEIEEAFKAGANWMLEEAADWIGNYLMEIGYPDDWLRDSLNIKSGKERFRKAMEE